MDVLLDVPVSVYEAMLGTKVAVPTLDGQVTITIPPGTSSGAKLRIKERGVFRGDEKGDQHCIVKIVVPKDLDDAAEELAASSLVPHEYYVDPVELERCQHGHPL